MAPVTLAEACQIRADRAETTPIAGGTDLMVEINFGHRRPTALLDLTEVEELHVIERSNDVIRLGAAVPYTVIIETLATVLPGLAQASRTVGSPQIRNRGSVGGNLATGSPAGDALPPLVAAGATVELSSVRGTRELYITDFLIGPKQTALASDELIVSVNVPVARGPQTFSKIGTRNAMVIAVCSLALDLDPVRRRIGTAIGSAAPTTRQATAAEAFAADAIGEINGWDRPRELPESLTRRFGELVAGAANPIDDVRGTAAYRRHALGVLARRSLVWVWDAHRKGA